MNSKVAIVIPFFKARDKLNRCLEHLRRQSYSNVEVFVRDNSEDNIYFTAAVNEGLRHFITDPAVRYIGVLNQDAYLDPRAIEVLVDFMEHHSEAGVACPLQVDAEGQVTWGGSLRAFPKGTHLRAPLASYTAPIETHWGNGAALLIRVETIREVGLFDSNMRFICSDADFTLTTRARGWKVLLVPEARCEHSLHGSGSSTTDLQLEAVKLRDVLYFSRKWVSGDLYRELAYEGPSLTRTGIRIEINQIEKSLQTLEARLAAGFAQPNLPTP